MSAEGGGVSGLDGRIRELAAQGRSDASIGADIGLSAGAVFMRRKRAGIESQWRRPEMKHGRNGYNKGCRCDVCRAATSRYMRGRRTGVPFERVPSHGISGYVNYGCRCEACSAAKSARNLANREQIVRARRATYEKSLVAAIRHRYQWTGPELEVAARSDLTAPQAAALLGRTVNAVRNVRRAMQFDPRTARLAGLSTDAARMAQP